MSLYAALGSCRNSCRQCQGVQRLSFDYYTREDVATNFWKASIGNCATGAELDVIGKLNTDCRGYCVEWSDDECVKFIDICKNWFFTLKIWRYCGNGGSVNMNKGKHCINNICATQDNFSFSCSHSVDCHGDCHCDQCGC